MQGFPDAAVTRLCRIKAPGEGRESFLAIKFFLPIQIGPEEFEARATLECEYFTRTINSGGIDGMQAFFCLTGPVLACLNKAVLDGFGIYFLEEGDLNLTDFLRYKP
jgi:hypothetical protein